MLMTMDRILILACFLLAGPLAAQQEGEAAPPDEPPASTAERPAADEQDEAADRETPPPSPDTFDPSEEISLDLPVSFPVDI